MVEFPAVISAETLREVDLFRGLTPEELAAVLALAREEVLKKDQLLFRERDPGDKLYVVLSGVIEIGRASADGRRVRLVRLERGEVFGELPMFDEGIRSASATAVIVPETHVAAWSFADLSALFDRNPALACKVMRSLSKKLSVRLRATTDGLFALLKELHRGAV